MPEIQFDIDARQTGKTRRILEWMRETPDSIIICHSMREVDRVFRLAHDLTRDRFTTMEDIRVLGKLYPPSDVGIDNADLILQSLIGKHRLSYVTATGQSPR